jgi:hypothetical protein
MHQFDLDLAIKILERTPNIVKGWLINLPEEWSQNKRSSECWSVYDIVGHFIHGEKTDWIPRAKIILQKEEANEFEPFDRFAQFSESKGKKTNQLVDEFCQLREKNLDFLREFDIQSEDYNLQGKHPELGIVNLKQLLSTWVVHDLEHLSQMAKEIALLYKEDVGPWLEYLNVLKQ